MQHIMQISADKKSLTIGNIKPGTHTLTLRAKGYVDALTAQIVVAEGVDEPEVTFVPVVKSLEYTGSWLLHVSCQLLHYFRE